VSAETVGVVLADDHPVIRDGLAALLGAVDGIEVIATAGSGDEAVRVTVARRPAVLVVDLHMPGGTDGVAATRAVRAAAPEVGVLVLTMLDDDASVRAALDAGAAGYVLKGDSRQQIVRAIHAVAAGATFLGSGVTPRALDGGGDDPFAGLTARERRVLDLLASGLRQAWRHGPHRGRTAGPRPRARSLTRVRPAAPTPGRTRASSPRPRPPRGWWRAGRRGRCRPCRGS
jgi:DNA-binding NarL/FixJ family response regulator